MTVNERISIIRLSEKINKNFEYAKLLGISVISKKENNSTKTVKKCLKSEK